MQRQLALIADSANVSVEGKINILGEFDTIWAPAVPATHPSMWFVAKLNIDGSDVGTHRVLLRIVDEDGNTVLAPLTAELQVSAPDATFSGEHPSVPVVLMVANAPFARFGKYIFELRIDDNIIAEVPLHVRKWQGPGGAS